jgi:hypothetical protein
MTGGGRRIDDWKFSDNFPEEKLEESRKRFRGNLRDDFESWKS